MTEEKSKISNGLLARLFTTELLIWAIGTIFLLGVVWSNLSGGLAFAQTTATENKQKIESVARDVSEMKGDMKVIKAQNKRAEKDMEEQREDIKRILRLLGDNHVNGKSGA